MPIKIGGNTVVRKGSGPRVTPPRPAQSDPRATPAKPPQRTVAPKK